MKTRSTRARARRGMTLIEIIVVITIVSMLMTAVTVYAVGILDDSRRKTARLDIRTLMTSLDMYKMTKGRFPDTGAGLKVLVDAKLVKELPRDPWGTEYAYALENGEPLVSSYGADAQPGGTGSDADVSSKNLAAD